MIPMHMSSAFKSVWADLAYYGITYKHFLALYVWENADIYLSLLLSNSTWSMLHITLYEAHCFA